MDQLKRAWLYRIDAPEDEHGCLKGQKWITQNMGFVVVGASQDTGSGLNFYRNGLA